MTHHQTQQLIEQMAHASIQTYQEQLGSFENLCGAVIQATAPPERQRAESELL